MFFRSILRRFAILVMIMSHPLVSHAADENRCRAVLGSFIVDGYDFDFLNTHSLTDLIFEERAFNSIEVADFFRKKSNSICTVDCDLPSGKTSIQLIRDRNGMRHNNYRINSVSAHHEFREHDPIFGKVEIQFSEKWRRKIFV